MKKSGFFALMCALATISAAPAAAADTPQVAAKGRMLMASNGLRLGPVYRVAADGSAQLIIDGKLVTIPASTISLVDGKLVTSLSKKEVSNLN